MLYQSPFIEITPRAPEGLFSSSQVEELLSVPEQLRQNAYAACGAWAKGGKALGRARPEGAFRAMLMPTRRLECVREENQGPQGGRACRKHRLQDFVLVARR